jgi:hypothetical protein
MAVNHENGNETRKMAKTKIWIWGDMMSGNSSFSLLLHQSINLTPFE